MAKHESALNGAKFTSKHDNMEYIYTNMEEADVKCEGKDVLENSEVIKLSAVVQ